MGFTGVGVGVTAVSAGGDAVVIDDPWQVKHSLSDEMKGESLSGE